ncbi:hypothetical protein [Bradyrhizobium paxllaeri]|uniref:hypothetical protein n=1 Tax=Bradyrhizobium paxllaeri TaxID=190148 RepID=UPI0008103766|nr:hypothetical protein [Bradyrhizobium paxllaeri]
MKHWGLAAVLGTALATNWVGSAFGQTGCPATFEGATAKELLACITSIQNSIAELKNKGAGISAVGYVDATGPAAAISLLSGSIKATVKKTGNGAYDVTYFAAQPKIPIVLVGPRSEELMSVAITSSSELAFSVVIRGSDGGPRNAGFWFVVVSP